MNYSQELKEAMLRRMLPPNNESITKISKEEGISEQTLRNWRDKARKEGYATPGTDAAPDKWNTQDTFLIVMETANMNETELAEYARKKGLYVEQIKAWKDACINANGGVAKEAARLNRELKNSDLRVKSSCNFRKRSKAQNAPIKNDCFFEFGAFCIENCQSSALIMDFASSDAHEYIWLQMNPGSEAKDDLFAS